MASPVILAVPCIKQGHGGGHLTRCASLVKDLRAMGREARLFLPQNAITEKIENLIKTIYFNSEWIETNEKLEISNDGFIILDRFQTPQEELLRWKSIAPVIGIDEGGAYRNNFDFLIDILIPEKMSKTQANIFSPALVLKNLTTENTELLFDSSRYPQVVRMAEVPYEKIKNKTLKVFITFGHEDTAGLGIKTARSLSALSEKHAMDITLLRGALTGNNEQLAMNNVRILDAIPNLAEHLNEYDLVITHYGITAYEALYAGVNVLLAHPTPYHKKLSKAAGFISFNERSIKSAAKAKKVRKVKTNNPFVHHHASLQLKNNTTLAALINTFSPQVNRQCPVCAGNSVAKSAGNFVAKGSAPPYLRCSPLIARYHDRTYRRCNKCGIIYMDRTCPPPVEYAKDYFFESYKNQYGKTYLEDFDNIKTAGKRRLKHIISIISHRDTEAQRSQREEEKRKKIKNKNTNISNNNFASSVPPRLCENSSLSPRLLDIGCAYGPFLAAAKEEGFSPLGIDPAEEAVRYVQQELGIPAIHGFFPLPTPHSPHSFDVITLWYVIEHFKDCKTVLAEIKRLLKPNGILAFSTPSFSGISARGMDYGGRGMDCGGRRLINFLRASPADHYTVWSPKTSKKALMLAGFKVKKIVSAGHHPERFPLLGKFAKTKKSPVYWLLLAISKIFSLGDTFEVYAQMK